MHDDAPDPQLLSIASSISDREPLDWEGLRNQLPADQAEIVEQLRFVESVARLGEDAPTVWGPYAIVGEIGRGAFGTVYRAYDPELNREVALKVVRPVRRMRRSTRSAPSARLAQWRASIHPNVVRVFRVDRIGDEIGMAMELIRVRRSTFWCANADRSAPTKPRSSAWICAARWPPCTARAPCTATSRLTT
jgi:hypothetical protein